MAKAPWGLGHSTPRRASAVLWEGMAETLRSARPGALRIALAVASIVALISLHGSCKKSKPDRPRIAVIPKGTTHEFWKSVHAGAVKASRELNAKGIKTKVFWKGPLREDDRDQQIQTVENFATRGVSGIVLAPLDS